jgi:hypothetical protein
LIETLLVLIFLALAAIVVLLHSIDNSIDRWAAQWGTNALPASDYQAKEILEVLQEISTQQQKGGRAL